MVNDPKIHSMTGFARSSGGTGPYSWTWEAKSVNGKGLDIRCRLPQGLDELDVIARGKAGKTFSRGNVSLHLSIRETGTSSRFQVNRELLDQLVDISTDLAEKTPGWDTPRLDGLLAVKGVIEPLEEEAGDEEVAARNKEIANSLDQVLKELLAARSEEGARITEALTQQIEEIAALKKQAESVAEVQPEAIKDKLSEQVRELLEAHPSLPEERLAQEAALLMTKGDVREELDRLDSHLTAAKSLISEGGVVGRKLDFLCQEFNREANTICSKAQEIELSNIGLELKAVIEQFREQVQNIE